LCLYIKTKNYYLAQIFRYSDVKLTMMLLFYTRRRVTLLQILCIGKNNKIYKRNAIDCGKNNFCWRI